MGNMLMWNGDIFRMSGVEKDTMESDTTLLSRHLSTCQTPTQVLECMASITGPWAMVYLQETTNTLWFGRDFFGRQSLLISSTPDSLSLSSCVTSDMDTFTELPASGLFSCSLSPGGQLGQVRLYPWDCMVDQVDSDKNTSLQYTISSQTIRCPVRLDQFNPSTVPASPLPHSDSDNSLFQQLLSQPDIDTMVDQFTDLLRAAVRTRITNQPGLCKDCVTTKLSSPCPHSSVAVLFSGGLDSCVLAHLAAEQLPPGQPLHLLNVAFQQGGGGFDVPDRLTGIQAFKELVPLHTERLLSLVLVNVALPELQTNRSSHIKHLLHPLHTVLDDSIGCAIWFAARGKGVDFVTGEEVDTPARVLLLGMGIDEQLGGYSRHRTRFNREGHEGLAEELRMELLRISERNLGRDNRIVSDHGVAPRFPFLDEDVVNFLLAAPMSVKCDFSYERGEGEKLILRLVAHKLGLRLTAREPKRAVQFGSRIAKMEKRKEKGGQVAVRE
eukprot:GFUD01012303.1.p1 GENE.GFUD01012303.1~~GFUD01012303.1.p1  ORF type:complete len:580 (+),score=219.59 GFUD01012303.1:250-1740(+)